MIIFAKRYYTNINLERHCIILINLTSNVTISSKIKSCAPDTTLFLSTTRTYKFNQKEWSKKPTKNITPI